MPAPWPHLQEAPITEALIDARCELPSDVNLKTLAGLHDAFGAAYPKKLLVAEWQQQIQLGTSEAPPEAKAPTGGPQGYRFDSSDGLQVLQARINGFTLSRLRPYQDWHHLITEFKRCWEFYVTIAGVKRVSRIATRFINRIAVPTPVAEIADWLYTRPELPSGLNFSISDYSLTFVAPCDENGTSAIIRQFTEAADRTLSIPIIFDIDVFREVSLTPPSLKEMWSILDELRTIKNQVFFSSITPRTLSLF